MGVYDIIGENQIQIKATQNPHMKVYQVGDKIKIDNGLYLCTEGWFVVDRGIVIAEGKEIFDKFGNDIVEETVDFIKLMNPYYHMAARIEEKYKKS